MLNPNDPPHVQIEKQSRIIDALMRRANRQQDVGPSAFRAFQSAIELRQKVEAQSRDLARAATELESARFEQEQTRRNLAEALSSMEQGFALFTDGRLDLLNERFRIVLPDIADQVAAGQTFSDLAALFVRSTGFVSSDKPLALLLASTEMEDHA
ncbi:MAG: hybrid sensor histidine kinase/response regulator, partial [Pseudomonadota bacterium]